VRSNIISSLAAMFVAFAHFAAVSAAFSLPVSPLADQPAVTAMVASAQSQSVPGVDELIVEVRRPL
jgi:hypothetical protein